MSMSAHEEEVSVISILNTLLLIVALDPRIDRATWAFQVLYFFKLGHKIIIERGKIRVLRQICL